MDLRPAARRGGERQPAGDPRPWSALDREQDRAHLLEPLADAHDRARHADARDVAQYHAQAQQPLPLHSHATPRAARGQPVCDQGGEGHRPRSDRLIDVLVLHGRPRRQRGVQLRDGGEAPRASSGHQRRAACAWARHHGDERPARARALSGQRHHAAPPRSSRWRQALPHGNALLSLTLVCACGRHEVLDLVRQTVRAAREGECRRRGR